MRTLLALTFVFLPLIQAQDSWVVKSVEPDYSKYSPDLVTDFETAIAPVTVTVQADGKPFAFNSVPLPMAVVMALKDYEFQPRGTITVPHGRIDPVMGSYEVTLKVPIRQSKDLGLQGEEAGVQNSARAAVIVVKDGKPAVKDVQGIRIGPGIMKGMVLHRVQPTYPEAAKEARIQGTVTLEAVISKQGDVESLRASNGPLVLVEAAYEAVKQWKYRPFLQSREPIEVVGDVSVVFNLD